MKEEWNQWLRAIGHGITTTGHLKRQTISQVCEWVIQSWNAVETETIVKSFKKMWHQ